jgi:SpoVK/Ycf46/Vps4 family AAA+-type ATPase
MHEDLKFHIRSLSRFVYYVTEEEDRFITDLHENLSKSSAARRISVYSSTFGLVPVEDLLVDWRNRVHKESNSLQINEALIQIYKDDPKQEQNFYVITDPHRWLTEPQVVRRILNLAHQLHSNEKIIKILFFVGPRLVIPQQLQRYIEVVHDRGLSEDETRKTLFEICGKLKIQPTDPMVKAFRGLTSYEIDAAVSQSIIATKKDSLEPRRIDPKFVADFKRRQLRKTDLVNYVDVSDHTFKTVGGVGRFKAWANKTKAAWTDEGQKFGLTPPKGVLLAGVWGCGKSISAKALGTTWKLPVIQLELGKLRQSGVGDSENNTYKTINLIEAVAPCIVWIDEAEKSLSGGQSSAQSDAGTTGRMIAILSTWLQETTAKVCLVMTANSLKTLPTEFVRRCNERFFFTLPTEEERVDILKIHLTKKQQDPAKYNLANLADDAKLMVGSEIEHAIEAAMVDSFDAGKSGLDETVLSLALRNKPRIFKTLANELKEMLDWVGYDKNLNEGIRARFASDRSGDMFQMKEMSDG